MMATKLVLAVCYPYAVNISGGGFKLHRLNFGEIGLWFIRLSRKSAGKSLRENIFGYKQQKNSKFKY